jgi:TRAP-type mannitol/chloroaromatic compound transport system permease large subunit
VPILAPVAAKILPELVPGLSPDMVMIWFGVILAMNLQTSFLTPPFGFALFYLRSVAPMKDYRDRVTGATIPAVSTAQIYKGSIAFIVIQVFMVAMVMSFPQLVAGNIEVAEQVNVEEAEAQMAPKDDAFDAAPIDPMDGASEPASAASQP